MSRRMILSQNRRGTCACRVEEEILAFRELLRKNVVGISVIMTVRSQIYLHVPLRCGRRRVIE